MEERIEELMIDYLNGSLSDEDQKTWDRLVEEGSISQEDINGYQAMMTNLDKIGQKEPSQQMTDNFYTMLNDKIAKTDRYTILDQFASFLYQKGLSRGGLQAGYSLVVLILGLGVGYALMGRSDRNEITSLSSEVQEMKSMMMLSLLEKDSPSDRIKAVSMAQGMAAVDDEVVNALFTTLNGDKNTNVRLEALDALVRYAHKSDVRSKLIESIVYQTNPLVQLALADIMVLLQNKSAKRALEDLLNNESTSEEIKPLIEERINAINI